MPFVVTDAPRYPKSVGKSLIESSRAVIQWMLTGSYRSSHEETFILSHGRNMQDLNFTTGTTISAQEAKSNYSIQLNSLKPGIQYFYQIESKNQYESLFTEVFSFITNDSRKFVGQMQHLLELIKFFHRV